MDLNSFTQCLNKRYATKIFDSTKKIPESTVNELLRAAKLSASSFGLQPWKFFVVTNQETREKLRAHSWNQPQITDSSHLVVLASKTNMDESYVNEYIRDIATTRSIDPSSLEEYRKMMIGFINNLSESAKVEWMTKQTYIALGTLLAAYAVAHIDSCPMEGFDPKAYDEILGLQAHGYSARVLCPLGIRSENDKSSQYQKVRFSDDKIISFL